MTTITILLVIIIMMLMPAQKISDAELDAFERFVRWVWRAVILTAKLIVLSIAVGMLCANLGTANVVKAVSLSFVGGILAYMGLRIALWAVGHVMPNPLVGLISAKTDPIYLTDGAARALKRVF